MMPREVSDNRILEAMVEIPRHLFVETKWEKVAYSDAKLPLTPTRAMLQPEVLGKILQEANISATDKVLDIACGSGYSTAIISRLAGWVVGVEVDKELAYRASLLLPKLQLNNLAIKHGELLAGDHSAAPFNKIIINIPIEHKAIEPLLAQLINGGKLFVIEGCGKVTKLVEYLNNDNNYSRLELFEAA